MRRLASILAPALCLISAAAIIGGCGRPNRANIELRRQNAALRDQVAQLERTTEGLRASVRSLEAQATTVPVLPQDRVAELITTHGLSFGRLTSGADIDPDTPGDEGVVVHVAPVDQQNQPIKAAGSFSVRVFDLSGDQGELLVGECDYSVEEAREAWRGRFTLYEYALTCPFERRPQGATLTVRVTFTDALTQRTFTEQREVTVNLPPPQQQPSPGVAAETGTPSPPRAQ